ncbi:crotonyl-CoA carboxylase/reductase [Rhodoplanes sp. TEM]|uniref:Crotonyl-CoA carboxylase/reductase n=1 Tax=Rhodoplanes tepidamans TaxID=200616 RepID=A0ABT5JES6_RHOTP|nr:MULTISPECIES: crotonyl-CoA carboxylase/reductase [Rhodoplanes]MDC7788191.1 crotonyl-CoA carboxylase/reductase [Rhodoplanes tepidamans]MDC7987892.1 crotonyl-CoA carboxylase/reductase [Rhodoplanes sp. TEM]MDQ0354225.1 crotonyl-CoA reductase [Rhodoplanes tepidamans]
MSLLSKSPMSPEALAGLACFGRAGIADLLEMPGLTVRDYAAIALPEEMSALAVLAEDEERVAAVPPPDRRASMFLHHVRVRTPEPGPGEVLIAVMAAGLNYNSVWSATFQPASPFRYLKQFSSYRPKNRAHLAPYMIIGSDAAGIVLRLGPGVENCRPGDHVCIHPLVADEQVSECHEDSMLAPTSRAWGFETNFGAYAEFALVRATQILPKPAHLTWEEAATLPLVNCTVYRMLVSEHGAKLRVGENMLIWGAGGGLGMLACQYALLAGARPLAVVSSDERAAAVRRIGVEAVIDRRREGLSLWTADGAPDERGIVKLRRIMRRLLDDEDPDVVFEHPGAETFYASVTLLRHGGRVVTCGSSSGYEHRFDNRRLWMHVKSIIGSHGANYHEAWLANRLVCKGLVQPVLTRCAPMAEGPAMIDLLQSNRHVGKCALLCLAREEGRGVTDPAARERFGTEAFLAAVRPQ